MQLLALQVIAESISGIAYSNEMLEPLYGQIDKSSSTASQEVGGVLSSLARTKDEKGQTLIVGVGVGDERNRRWKLNEGAISKAELKELVNEILATW